MRSARAAASSGSIPAATLAAAQARPVAAMNSLPSGETDHASA